MENCPSNRGSDVSSDDDSSSRSRLSLARVKVTPLRGISAAAPPSALAAAPSAPAAAPSAPAAARSASAAAPSAPAAARSAPAAARSASAAPRSASAEAGARRPVGDYNTGVSPYIAVRAPANIPPERLDSLSPMALAYESRAKSPMYSIRKFWTCSEIIAKLPHVQKLWETYRLFVEPPNVATIDILKVGDCLRAMGVNFEDSHMKMKLVKHLLRFPQLRPATSANFELVLAVYSEVLEVDPMPACDVMIRGLSSYDDYHTLMLPADRLRRVLSTVGQRFTDAATSDMLDSMTDRDGDVNYVTLMKKLFPIDTETPNKLQQVRLYLTSLGKNAYHMDLVKRDDLIRALRKADRENTGYVMLETMLKLLRDTDEIFSFSELVALAKGITNDDQQIYYRKFIRMIMSG
ncbi:hypothetical protein AWZ03_011671 [Drosophila navojoa]|uniref:EF-hand domain-containing protein n=1 Tax=Drosophila navojoa TaxID=7232 RepID=A0A484AZI6_DRONA|nr:hypothetical protein AWZ03_011671 [Drosophila navojoa]